MTEAEISQAQLGDNVDFVAFTFNKVRPYNDPGREAWRLPNGGRLPSKSDVAEYLDAEILFDDQWQIVHEVNNETRTFAIQVYTGSTFAWHVAGLLDQSQRPATVS